jgi:hypothetical protein
MNFAFAYLKSKNIATHGLGRLGWRASKRNIPKGLRNNSSIHIYRISPHISAYREVRLGKVIGKDIPDLSLL